MRVPFFRPELTEDEIDAVASVLRSGWLTSGPAVAELEQRFAAAVGARSAVALSSATAALHLAVEALGLAPGDRVLVPTMTFAATAEVVRYGGAEPILVDCDPVTGNMDLEDAERKIAASREGLLPRRCPPPEEARTAAGRCPSVVGVMPVHVGGYMMDVAAVKELADRHGLWIVEDAAHAFPSAWRPNGGCAWIRCGDSTADVTCFSFYANKTITTGEGGMAVTSRPELAEKMRLLALHGISSDAWGRSSDGAWDYRIQAPGYKYNMPDMAAALGIKQLERAEAMREARACQARRYLDELAEVEAIELPPEGSETRSHSWHLFPIRLRLEILTVNRDRWVAEMEERGVGFSVHWRPLHLHPYYEETFDWRPDDLPVATREWARRVSLPIFPAMRAEEQGHVIEVVKRLCEEFSR
jgi:dTDP-4-amino-4,6-dideoxygalactose transaminase